MKIKVSELTEEKLAEWVARARGWEVLEHGVYSMVWIDESCEITAHVEYYRPDINGGQAMELQKEFSVAVIPPELGGLWQWAAGTKKHYSGLLDKKHELGETPEIAICRAVVSSVYGEYIEDEQ